MIFIARVRAWRCPRDGASASGKNGPRHGKAGCASVDDPPSKKLQYPRLDSERIRAIITVKSGFVPFVRRAAPRRAARAKECTPIIKIELNRPAPPPPPAPFRDRSPLP